ncbi:hypothetical protein ACFSTD_24045 [Novosphingobium colocasiae]
MEMVKFVDFTHRRKLPENDGFFYISEYRHPSETLFSRISQDPSRPVAPSRMSHFSLPSTWVFAKVIIIGMDHRFSAVGTPNASEIRSAEKKTMITSTQTIFPKE